MQHVVSVENLSDGFIETVFKEAVEIQGALAWENSKRALATRHLGRIVATLFYEPSTRTRLSFESAAGRLGAGVISTENAREFSSASKGETLEDTIRTVAGYADVIALRHFEDDASDRAAAVSEVPIINAGSGMGEHPTQALLDAYTIHSEMNRLCDLNYVIGGDLKHGRTARSLAKLAARSYGTKFTFVSTPELRIGQNVKDYLTEKGRPCVETGDMKSALAEADVVYWTRLQKERMTDPTLASGFTIGEEELGIMKSDAIIMHPLPRNDEIAPSVDQDPRAKYFIQAKNGLYVRMALLNLLLSHT